MRAAETVFDEVTIEIDLDADNCTVEAAMAMLVARQAMVERTIHIPRERIVFLLPSSMNSSYLKFPFYQDKPYAVQHTQMPARASKNKRDPETFRRSWLGPRALEAWTSL